MNIRIVPGFLSIYASTFLIAGQVYGQGATSRFIGTVIDTTGAVVPGATVNLTNEVSEWPREILQKHLYFPGRPPSLLTRFSVASTAAWTAPPEESNFPARSISDRTMAV